MSLLDDVSIVVTPNGYKAGTLYGVLPTATESSELVTSWTNNDFSSFASSGSNITQMVSSGSGNNNYSAVTITSGKIYKLQFTSTQAINCQIRISPNTSLTSATVVLSSLSLGSNEIEFTAPSNYAYIGFYAASSFTDTQISDFTLKEQTKSDMDVTRATAATRVDENGLVNYAEILGSELVVNGDFSSDTWWQKSSANVNISNGKGNYTGGTTEYFYKNNTLEIGKTYKLVFEITDYTTGYISAFGGNWSGPATAVKTWEKYFTCVNTTFGLVGNSFIGSIDNVTVKEVTRNNVPRIDYTGGGCPHILSEPQRTNIVTYSEDLSQWTIANGTLTPNATVSPDGTQNAGRVVFNNTALDLKRTVTVVAGQTYTISFYIKLESGTGLQGRFYDNSNSTNIEYYTYTSQVQGTEWSRVTRSVTAPSGCTEMQIWLLAASSSLVTASFWGAQFEAGSYATSYIPTSGSSVTRNQDLFTRDGIASLINSPEGVLFVEMAALVNDSTKRTIGLSDGTNTNRLAIRYDAASNTVQGFMQVGGATKGNVNVNSFTITNFLKIAYKWKAGDFALWINGAEVATSTDATSFGAGVLTKMQFNEADGAGDEYSGKLRQLQLYKTALTDAQLTSLTS